MLKIPFHMPSLNCFRSPSPERENNVDPARSNSGVPKAEGSKEQIKHRKSSRQTALIKQWTSARNAGSVASSSRSNPKQNTGEKAQLAAGLQRIKQHFATLLEKNWSPDKRENAYDAAMLPILVAAENKRSPNLKLSLVDPAQGFGKWLKDWQKNAKKEASARVMIKMPGFSVHRVAADIRRDKKGNVSVLVVEPLGLKGQAKKVYENEALKEVQKELRDNALDGKVTMTVLALDTQKSVNDCRIFGLSAAAKMADETRLFDVLHEQNLAGEFMTAKGETAQILAGLDRIRIIDGKGVLPPSFVKHSQSETVLKEWLAQNPSAFANASVNKPGPNKPAQTLIERFEKHKTIRYQDPFRMQYLQMMKVRPKLNALRVGTSIEEKRLTYIDRALAYLNEASEREVNAFLQNFNEALRVSGLPDPENLRLDQRSLGPHPDTL